jgi:hypothetical protein
MEAIMAESLGGEIAGSAVADIITHPLMSLMGIGRHGHGAGTPGPIAKAFAGLINLYVISLREHKALPEVRTKFMTLLGTKWAEGEFTNLQKRHEEVLKRELRVKSGSLEKIFDEDDFVALLGGLVYKIVVKDEHAEKVLEEERTKKGDTQKHTKVLEKKHTQKVEVVRRPAAELHVATEDDFLKVLNDLAGKKDAFIQFLYGLEDDGWKQKVADALMGVATELNGLARWLESKRR